MISRLVAQGLRQTLRRPSFGSVVVLVVGLSVGLTAAAAALVYEIVCRALPFHDGKRLAIYCCPFPEQGEGWCDAPSSPAAIRDYQRAARSVDEVAIFYDQHSLNLTTSVSGGAAQRLPVMFVSGNYFPLLSTSPTFERYFASPFADIMLGVRDANDIWLQALEERVNILPRTVSDDSPGWQKSDIPLGISLIGNLLFRAGKNSQLTGPATYPPFDDSLRSRVGRSFFHWRNMMRAKWFEREIRPTGVAALF